LTWRFKEIFVGEQRQLCWRQYQDSFVGDSIKTALLATVSRQDEQRQLWRQATVSRQDHTQEQTAGSKRPHPTTDRTTKQQTAHTSQLVHPSHAT